MLVSTFELLVKDQLPKDISIPAPFEQLRRTVIQGYFLTIANTQNEPVKFTLRFTSLTPGLDIDKTLTYLDVTGSNVPGDLQPGTPGRARTTITLGAKDTCLFILQPDILKDDYKLLKDADFEVRGYVEILNSDMQKDKMNLLVTAEHRGTFFNGKILSDPAAEVRLDQFVSVLPLANGTSLYSFREVERDAA